MNPLFKEDLAELSLWMSERDPGAAIRFIEAVEQAVYRLEDNPEIGARRDVGVASLAGLRIWPVPEFPTYLILYLPHEDGGVLPIRLIHGATDYPRRLRQDFFEGE